MEEKERYEYYLETNSIKDNKTNKIYDYVVDLLNQQDKENQQLKQQLEELNESLYQSNIELYAMKNLRQQLYDLPKKIVGEIKEQLFNHFKVKNIEEYEKLSLIDSLFTLDTVIEILDTILKKYGGENE